MLEMMLLLTVAVVGFALFAVVMVGLLIVKGVFRLLLFPLSLAAGLLKIVVFGIVALFLLALLPIGLAAMVLAVPVLFVIAIIAGARALMPA